MSHKTLSTAALCTALVLGGIANTAHAQLFGRRGCNCGPAPIAPQMQVSYLQPQAVCQPAPVVCQQVQPAFTQVPVTEMRAVTQTVQRPVTETKYVEQPVTEYVPVTETRTAQIPTVSYQNVTEYQQRTRDCGQWITNYQCRPQMSACEYDSRPGFLGWWNRSTYSARMSMTPQMVAERTYVPNMVTEMVPISRQVPVYGNREVNYQVTTMVPRQTSRTVAVQTTRMVAEQITTQTPVTVMRTVPTGVAMGMSFGTSATALAPASDPISTARKLDPAPITSIPRREASRPRIESEADTFDNRSSRRTDAPSSSVPARRSSLRVSGEDAYVPEAVQPADDPHSVSAPAPVPVEVSDLDDDAVVVRTSPVAPSAVRVNQWVARRRPTTEPSRAENISVAATKTSKSR